MGIDKHAAWQIRQEAIEAYGGPRCVNCNETFKEILVIDHINGNGNCDRLARGGGTRFFRSLRRDGWPDGYQVLCMPCNFLKHSYPELLEDYRLRGIEQRLAHLAHNQEIVGSNPAPASKSMVLVA